ncbi:MAG: hypothetical protein RJB01_220 [Actinomycetota bacterium]
MFDSNQHPLKVLAVLPVLGQPRHAKRIEMLKQAGFEVRAAAFERPYHKGRLPKCELVVLGTIEHGKLLRRIWRLLRAIPALRREICSSDCIYASGLDSALLAICASFPRALPLAMEVGDIREAQTAPRMHGVVMRMLDRFVCRHASLLAVTAEKFYSVYYKSWIGAHTPAVVLENKLEKGFVDSLAVSARIASPDGTPLVDRPMRIGYFGLLRCPWSWDVLRDLAANHRERVELVIAGRAIEPSDLEEQAKAFPNMRYLGEYKSPQDLERLYTQVDLVWACYPPLGSHDWNLRWARPNRFYESCCFFRPLLSREGSCDSVDVRRFGIGLCINEDEPHAAASRIAEITPEDLTRWRASMMEVPRSVYTYTDEVARLGVAIRSMFCTSGRPTIREHS